MSSVKFLQRETMPSIKTCIVVIFLLLARPQGQLVLASGRGKLKLELYQVDRISLIGPMVDDMVLDVTKYPKVSIRASGKSFLQNLQISSISFYVDDQWVRTDSKVPSWLLLGSGTTSSWTPTAGIHTIKAVANRRRGRMIFESLVRVNVQVSAPSSPVATAGSPMTVVSPMVAPSPPSLYVPPPEKAPVNAPTREPVPLPTERPRNQATTARPVSPAAPSTCLSNVVQYINSVTLSNQTLSESGASPLDEALRQLLVSNARVGVRLSPCHEMDRKRLRQRYAYFSLICSTGIVGRVDFDDDDECRWRGLTCNDGTVTELQIGVNMIGTVPADVGLWTGLETFSVGGSKLSGQLPSSMGAWTNLRVLAISDNKFNGTLPSAIGEWWVNMSYFSTSSNEFTGSLPASIGKWNKLWYFGASNNKFTGTIPNGVSNWTSIRQVFLHDNLFTGSVPTIGNNFCPKNFPPGPRFHQQFIDLWADCPEIACECCNFCCDGAGMNCASVLFSSPMAVPTAPRAPVFPGVAPMAPSNL
jgi:hypothetical protein